MRADQLPVPPNSRLWKRSVCCGARPPSRGIAAPREGFVVRQDGPDNGRGRGRSVAGRKAWLQQRETRAESCSLAKPPAHLQRRKHPLRGEDCQAPAAGGNENSPTVSKAGE